MTESFWDSEVRESFVDALLVPLLSYGCVAWVHLLGALV